MLKGVIGVLVATIIASASSGCTSSSATAVTTEAVSTTAKATVEETTISETETEPVVNETTESVKETTIAEETTVAKEPELLPNLATVIAGGVECDINIGCLTDYSTFVADEQTQAAINNAMFGLETKYIPSTFSYENGVMRVQSESQVHTSVTLVIDTNAGTMRYESGGYIDLTENEPEVLESGGNSFVYGNLTSLDQRILVDSYKITIENTATGRSVDKTIEHYDYTEFDQSLLPKWTGTFDGDNPVYEDSNGKKFYLTPELHNSFSYSRQNQDEADNTHMFLATNVCQKPTLVYCEYYTDRYIATVCDENQKFYTFMYLDTFDDKIYIIK